MDVDHQQDPLPQNFKASFRPYEVSREMHAHAALAAPSLSRALLNKLMPDYVPAGTPRPSTARPFYQFAGHGKQITNTHPLSTPNSKNRVQGSTFQMNSFQANHGRSHPFTYYRHPIRRQPNINERLGTNLEVDSQAGIHTHRHRYKSSLARLDGELQPMPPVIRTSTKSRAVLLDDLPNSRARGYNFSRHIQSGTGSGHANWQQPGLPLMFPSLWRSTPISSPYFRTSATTGSNKDERSAFSLGTNNLFLGQLNGKLQR